MLDGGKTHPAGQYGLPFSVHTVAPASATHPAAQASQTELAVAPHSCDAVIAGQELQLLDPADDHVPGGQMLQLSEPELAKRPAAHVEG